MQGSKDTELARHLSAIRELTTTSDLKHEVALPGAGNADRWDVVEVRPRAKAQT